MHNHIPRITPNPELFPVSELGEHLAQVAIDAANQVNSSITPVAVSMLSALSLTCQGLIKVRRLDHLVSPVSLFFLSIQPSGERKSAVNSLVLKGIHRFINESTSSYAEEAKRHSAKHAVWSSQRKGLENAIRKGMKNGEPTHNLAIHLEEHILAEPRLPKRLKLIHENTTPSALLRNLMDAYPTTSLISDEALVVLQNRGLSDLGTINKLWDGGRIEMDRVSSGETIITESALTLSLFVQNGVFKKLMDEKGDILRSSGLLARCFVVEPIPMAGDRFLAYKVEPKSDSLEWFWDRCVELLRRQIPDKWEEQPKKRIMSFDPEAQSLWEREHDYIEGLMRPNNCFQYLPDFGSKHADKIARLAATLHYFEGHDGNISIETLDRAIKICRWFANEFIRIFLPPPTIPQEQIDANLLLQWLIDHHRTTGHFTWYKNTLRQYGPYQLRNKARLEGALQELTFSQYILQYHELNSKKRVIAFTQDFLTLVRSSFLQS